MGQKKQPTSDVLRQSRFNKSILRKRVDPNLCIFVRGPDKGWNDSKVVEIPLKFVRYKWFFNVNRLKSVDILKSVSRFAEVCASPWQRASQVQEYPTVPLLAKSMEPPANMRYLQSGENSISSFSLRRFLGSMDLAGGQFGSCRWAEYQSK